jgi:mRNA interferase MazF
VTARIEPWQIWWVDLDPTAGREQNGRRPVLVVSSKFHLRLTAQALISVLPLTTKERPGWLHRVKIQIPDKPESWVITEQVRTISADRLTGRSPVHRLEPDQIAEVKRVLGRMLAL